MPRGSRLVHTLDAVGHVPPDQNNRIDASATPLATTLPLEGLSCEELTAFAREGELIVGGGDMFDSLKGWRTVLFNVGVAVGTAAAQGFAGFDWVSAVGPVWAPIILTGANVLLRVITTGPVGSKS